MPVTVAANSQKQVALLSQPRVRVELVYRQRISLPTNRRMSRVRRRCRCSWSPATARPTGLGLPLPAGAVVLFAPRAGPADPARPGLDLATAPSARMSRSTFERGGRRADAASCGSLRPTRLGRTTELIVDQRPATGRSASRPSSTRRAADFRPQPPPRRARRHAALGGDHPGQRQGRLPVSNSEIARCGSRRRLIARSIAKSRREVMLQA